jgi:hypothetical protein
MTLAVPSPEQIGRRFNLVNTVPTLTLVLYVSAISASGAPEQAPSLAHASDVISHLNAIDLALIGLATVALGLLIHPLQFALVQALEGYWTFVGPMGDLAAARARERHIARRKRLNDLWTDEGPLNWWERHYPEAISRRQQRASKGLADFPHNPKRTMPTRLGNVLRRAEDLAGERYGLNAIQWIPRLHPLAAPQMVAAISDARNQMDVALRFVLVWLVATAFTIPMLASHGPWLLLALGTYTLAWLAYRGGVHAARGYGETLVWTIDLYRFELVKQLRFPLPATHQREKDLNGMINTLLTGDRLRLGSDADKWLGRLPPYQHGSESSR